MKRSAFDLSFEFNDIRFPSSDGSHMLYGEIYKPCGKRIRGAVQLAHGMSDYVGRYAALAEVLAENGYAFAGHCHLGHGKSAASEDELGFFAEHSGADILINDMHIMNGVVKEALGDVPIVAMGHSMGSFIARLYAEKYQDDIKGLIIHATGGPKKAIFAGKLLVKGMGLLKGKRYRSDFVRSVASKSYNKKFSDECSDASWLSRDLEHGKRKYEDLYGSFTFTLSGYDDLFTLSKRANSKKWFKSYPKDMPTLIVSGDMDAVGDFGRGVTKVHDELLKRGHTALTFKLYKGARHELFGEINKEEVFSDIITFLGGVVG